MDQKERKEAIEAAFESVCSRLPAGTTLKAFEDAAYLWDCHPVKVGGKIVGAVLCSGAELHACVKPEAFGRWLTRKTLALVDKAVGQFGLAITRTGTEAGRQFVSRLGFVQDSQDPTLFVKASHGN